MKRSMVQVQVPSAPMSEPRQVSVERTIGAPAEDVFAVLVDPSMHPVIDGSGSVRAERGRNPQRLILGSRFGFDMKLHGARYPIRNVVVEYEPNRLIAWRHVMRHRWRWELEPVDGATRVTHTFDWSTNLFPPYVEWFGYPDRNRAAMERTLERLDRLVTTGAVEAS